MNTKPLQTVRIDLRECGQVVDEVEILKEDHRRFGYREAIGLDSQNVEALQLIRDYQTKCIMAKRSADHFALSFGT